MKRRISTWTLLENWKKKQLWNKKVTFIQIIICALGTITEELLKGQEDLKIRGQVETIQATALLRSTRILRRVLETGRDLLSLNLPKKTISAGWCGKLSNLISLIEKPGILTNCSRVSTIVWMNHMGFNEMPRKNAFHCWWSKGELISDVLLWISTHGLTCVSQAAKKIYIFHLCAVAGCRLKDLTRAMMNRDGLKERERERWYLRIYFEWTINGQLSIVIRYGMCQMLTWQFLSNTENEKLILGSRPSCQPQEIDSFLKMRMFFWMSNRHLTATSLLWIMIVWFGLVWFGFIAY